MVFTFEDSVANMKNPADAQRCAIRLLDHFSKHSKPSPKQEPKVRDRETAIYMFKCIETMCAIGLGPIMHQVFDVISVEREKLGRDVTQEEVDIIIRRVFDEYESKDEAMPKT